MGRPVVLIPQQVSPVPQWASFCGSAPAHWHPGRELLVQQLWPTSNSQTCPPHSDMQPDPPQWDLILNFVWTGSYPSSKFPVPSLHSPLLPWRKKLLPAFAIHVDLEFSFFFFLILNTFDWLILYIKILYITLKYNIKYHNTLKNHFILKFFNIRYYIPYNS